ncbi:Phosphotyrosyl phosphatase activator [Earliella scabrosa]|nr:Phosphotyrosyl phosphatase activator [Earliella scabrosa]
MATNVGRTPATSLPPLREVSVSSLDPADTPVLRIKTDEDVEAWKHTRGYQDYGLFLRRLAESVVGYDLPHNDPEPHQAVNGVITMLDTLNGWIDAIPPLPTPQRFGNLAFRTWGKRLEEEAAGLLKALLPAALHAVIPFVELYLLTSFGSFTRMDYGTGHETSFALFLLCLTLVRFFVPEPRVERQMVLNVYVRYLRLCWRLQDVYKLEPAGSHGVWGLDDYTFLSYIFGSAQLRDQRDIPVAAVLQPPLPPTNLYFMSIMRIHEVKSGPFHEHSSQLYSIATGVQYWTKVHTGLFKMYEAEVLGKRVVVQHIPLGGLLEWDAPQTPQSTYLAPTPAPSASSSPYTTMVPTSIPTRFPTPNRGAPLTFTTGVPQTTFPAATRYPQRASPSPILPARMPLGPTASTALRPTARSGTMAPPPPPTSHPSNGGQEA